MMNIPFDAALDTEAQVSAVVDRLATTLAGYLDAGPWRGPGVWHQWTPDAADPYVGHSAKMTRVSLNILVSYSITGAALVPSFVTTVTDCDRCILQASWAQAACRRSLKNSIGRASTGTVGTWKWWNSRQPLRQASNTVASLVGMSTGRPRSRRCDQLHRASSAAASSVGNDTWPARPRTNWAMRFSRGGS